MGICYAHLDLEERQKLARWREAKLPMKEIALRLGRAPSTLYREMRRNRFMDDEIPELSGYYGMTAQRAYEKRRAIHRKLVRHPAMKAAVVDRLKAGWSPERIAGRMKLEGHATSVSHETTYRYAYSGDGRSEALYRHLPEHRRRRRPRGTRRHHGRRFSNEDSISLRPVEVSERQQFGHWECDLVMFRKKFGKANITSLVERVSRFTVLAKNADRTSKPVMETLISGLKALPQPARRSITFDRGTEFTAWAHLKAGLGVAPWFCDPQPPWQKGSVEKLNKRARRYLPRETAVAALSDHDMAELSAQLNATPRCCLGHRPRPSPRNSANSTGPDPCRNQH